MHTWIGDDGTGNKLVEHDVPDELFDQYAPRRKHPHNWLISTSRDGLGDSEGSTQRRNVLDWLVEGIHAIVETMQIVGWILLAVVAIGAPVFTCVVLPILNHH